MWLVYTLLLLKVVPLYNSNSLLQGNFHAKDIAMDQYGGELVCVTIDFRLLIKIGVPSKFQKHIGHAL